LAPNDTQAQGFASLAQSVQSSEGNREIVLAKYSQQQDRSGAGAGNVASTFSLLRA
jgi:hypothetical protein